MPLVIGLMNIVVPLQIGARDVAFPFLNNLSFWFTAAAVVLINVSPGSVNSPRPAGWPIRPCRGWSSVPGRGRLLDMESADFWSGDPADRRELLRHHHPHAVPPGMTMMRLPVSHLDRPVCQHPDHRLLPDPDCHHRPAHRRPLPGYPFLYQ